MISIGMWFAIFCWGGAYVAARFLLSPETTGQIALSPLLLAAVRFSLAALFFAFPFMRAILHRQVSGSALLRMILLGQLTFTLYYWLQYLGIQQTNASVSSVLGVGLIPLFTALLTPFFGTGPFQKKLLAVLLSGFFGVALVVFQHAFRVLSQAGFLFGSSLLIVNTFLFALYNHLSKRWMQHIPPVVLTGGTMISGALGLILLSLFDPMTHWNTLGLLQLDQWLAILFLAIACSVLAYFAYNVALSHMDASRVAVSFYFEPVVSIVLSVTLLHEYLTWQTLLGAAIITGSVIMVNRMQR